MHKLPEKFLERLEHIFPKAFIGNVIQSFNVPKDRGVRINSLKVNAGVIIRDLEKRSFPFKKTLFFPHGLVLDGKSSGDCSFNALIEKGCVYFQNLSSMLVPVILDPHPGDDVLDMCAAPGSKTTQMAAMMHNEGHILALEAVKSRMYRLKSVVRLLGCENVSIKLMDARRFTLSGPKFDKILVDAPCSSEGRFRTDASKSTRYWSPRKIKEMQKKQKGLLYRACRLLKPGGELVYSTCTFAPEENETVVDWALKKMEGELRIEPLATTLFPTYPTLRAWGKKEFCEQITRCVRIMPDKEYDAFFIAKLKRKPWDY